MPPPLLLFLLLGLLFRDTSPWQLRAQQQQQQQRQGYHFRHITGYSFVGQSNNHRSNDRRHQCSVPLPRRFGGDHLAASNDDDSNGPQEGEEVTKPPASSSSRRSSYDLGLGKNQPFASEEEEGRDIADPRAAAMNWNVAQAVNKPMSPSKAAEVLSNVNAMAIPTTGDRTTTPKPRTTRRMVARDQASQALRGALWDEQHYANDDDDDEGTADYSTTASSNAAAAAAASMSGSSTSNGVPPRPAKFYPDFDLSIPETVYAEDGSIDLVWDLLRWEAYREAQREPLLVSFLYSTILNHDSLESSLSFLLANRLQSPAMMISTQLQSIILQALYSDDDATFRRSLRADMMAVRDRDPACNCLPDVFLYFKGFHALQSHRVAHALWKQGRCVLAQYLQSQVSQIFQIDIHPNATMSAGIMLDHGTGIVIGETATVGHNCSILHHVTLGGSGKKGVTRHPTVGNGVLLGAGATVLGPVHIGEGCQVGAGTLVISDLPAHIVAVGVPARIIGSFVDVTEQPALGMNQMMDDKDKIATFESAGI